MVNESSCKVQDANVRGSSSCTGFTQNRWRKLQVQRSKGFFSQPIKMVGYEVAKINSMLPSIPNPPEVIKSIFPRSVVYEIPYKKKQAEIKIQEALRREREALAERVKMKLTENQERNKRGNSELKDKNDQEMEKMRKEKEPFWYQDGQEAGMPPRNTTEYEYNKGLSTEKPEVQVPREIMGLDDSRNYIPGQFSDNIHDYQKPALRKQRTEDMKEMVDVQMIPHPPLPYPKHSNEFEEGLTETEKTIKRMEPECHPKKPDGPEGLIEVYPIDYMTKKGRHLERPKTSAGYEFGKTDMKGVVCKDFPTRKARLTTPWAHLRSEEFMKVGRPFKTEAARWIECNMPAFNPEEETIAIKERLSLKYKDTLNL